MVSFSDDWDKRLWYHPAECGGCVQQLVARPQVSGSDRAGLYYDALSGKMRVTPDNGDPGEELTVKQAADRLGISANQMDAWIRQNNRVFRHRYEGTD